MKQIKFILIFMIFSSILLFSTNDNNEEDNFIYTSDEDLHDFPTEMTRSTVQGTITDSNNVPVEDVCVQLLGNNNVLYTYTDENGDYEFTGVANGTSYTILPCKYEFTEIIDNSIVSGDSIISIAQAELGNTDGSSPGRYHGHNGGWCSEFVSWCYWQAGDPFTGGTFDGGACIQDWNMSTVHRVNAGFGRNENWQVMTISEINDNWSEDEDNPLEPQPGDYVFFSNTNGINRAHSGIVREIAGNDMETTEGNISDLVQEVTRTNWRTYQVGNTIVKGIGYRRIISNISFEPRFWYGYIYSNLDEDFNLFYFDDSVLEAPENIVLNIDGNDLIISWDEVNGATSYKIYSSPDPYESPENWTLEDEVTDTIWNETLTEIYKFYYVKAIEE